VDEIDTVVTDKEASEGALMGFAERGISVITA
jgi:hypothetical protein